MNPYKVLGVPRDANEKTIQKAYRKLARKWHPDLLPEEERERAEAEIKLINEAKDILLTPEKRSAYDAESMAQTNIYEYYANKNTTPKNSKRKSKSSTNIENEKRRRAVIQFLEVEYKHKNEIFDLFEELATGAVNDLFSEDEYFENLDLIIEELKDCISKIAEIIRVAKKKQIKGLDVILNQAQQAINELTEKENQTPKTLEQAKYVEETRRLAEKINKLIKGFRYRVNFVDNFNILSKTWEFNSDSELISYCKKIKGKVISLLNDIQWVERITTERNIKIGKIALGDPNSSWEGYRREKTLEQIKEIVLKKNQILNLNLQQLREKFWNEKCQISKNSKGQTVFKGVEFEECKGTFICPPNVTSIDNNAIYWLNKISTISIPAYLITESSKVELPWRGNLKQLILTFGEKSQVVDVSNYDELCITRKGNYICITQKYSWHLDFILIDENGVYIYDESKLCQLTGVDTEDELEELMRDWPYGANNYQLQIHAWAQVSEKLPDEVIMRVVPASADSAKRWIKSDKGNLERVLAENRAELKERIIRLYVGLGALGDDYSHQQAEWLITQLDFERMYRSRLERIPKENKEKKDPMVYVPSEAVEFVRANIYNKDFMPYILAFLEGYQLFKSEAKKEGVNLSTEFVIKTAPQYVFHAKAYEAPEFAKKLFEVEKGIKDVSVPEKILNLKKFAKKQAKKGIEKKIIETVDANNDFSMHYRYLELNACQTYLDFAGQFLIKNGHRTNNSRFFRVEAENVFISNKSHAIEVIDNANNRIAIVILNLFDEGELFADIMCCGVKSMDVIETIKRALYDQMKFNNNVTGISIGTNEAPRGERFNDWRNVLKDTDVSWIKFECHFKNREMGISYKGYRARFMVAGHEQYFDEPHRYITYEEQKAYDMWQRRINRRYW